MVFSAYFAGEIMAATGEPVEIAPPAVQKTAARDGVLSREQRLEQFKEIIKELHDGAEFSQLQDKFNKTGGDISPEEIADPEQTLVNEGLPEMEIKRMCHLYAALFKDALEKQEMLPVKPEHPMHTYMEENARAKELIAEIRQEASRVGGEAGASLWPFVVSGLTYFVKELAWIQTHYLRKENQLFPLLERHDFSAPGKVMWKVHDDIRGKFLSWPRRRKTVKRLRRAGKSCPPNKYSCKIPAIVLTNIGVTSLRERRFRQAI